MMIATATLKIEKLRREVVDKVRESQKQVEKEKRKLLENKGPQTVSYSICPNLDSLWLG